MASAVFMESIALWEHLQLYAIDIMACCEKKKRRSALPTLEERLLELVVPCC